MKTKPKICKSTTAETAGFGCGVISPIRTYGLCPKCLYYWTRETVVGMAWYEKQIAYKKKKVVVEEKKAYRKEKAELNTSAAMSLADTYFSRYVRLLFSNDGKCTCYTCGTIKPITEIDNGHYQKRGNKSTRYHLNNCRPQCKTCNGDTKHNGKQDIFRVNLTYEIGEEAVLELEELSRKSTNANTSFYRNIADTYREKVNELQRMLKVKFW